MTEALLYIVFILFAVPAFSPPKNGKVREALFFSCGVILAAVAAFRPGTLPDYQIYLTLFEDADWGSMVEPSFVLMAKIAKLLGGNPVFLFAIYAVLAVWVKMTAIRELSEFWFLSLLVYLSSLFLIQEMIQIRAGLSTAFAMLSIKPLFDRDGKRYLLFSLLAVFFHYSALVWLPLWFLGREPKRWLLWGLIPLGYLIYFTHGNLVMVLPIPNIQARLESYQSMQTTSDLAVNVFGVGVLIKCAIYYLLLWFADRLRKYNRHTTLLLGIYAVGIFCIPAFATLPVVSFRLSALFVAVEILVFPLLCHLFAPKPLVRTAVILIAAINIFLNLLVSNLLIPQDV